MRLALCFCAALASAQEPAPPKPEDPVATLATRLNLESYKATIKALAKFGDRREGTDRNRAALDWIEAQLKSYGCDGLERMRYEFTPPPPGNRRRNTNADPTAGPGGARRRGPRIRETVNNDPLKQPDEQLRALNSQPSTPGLREQVYCTKVGATHPEEMYIVSAHFDGIGYGEAANDDASGVAIVMEIARVLNSPDVRTDRSIRFALWNNEETGTNGARAYVTQRKDLQGRESPAGSGKYPEPRWLGMIQHDMMLFDHGMPRKDNTVSKEQRAEADVNIEYQVTSTFANQAMLLAQHFQLANEKYATDYPASVGPHMTNTDSGPFMDLVPSISLRELERGSQIANGWDPHHHQPTDLFSTYTDDDFRLGLNAAQTTLGAVGQLTAARIVSAAATPGFAARNGR